MHQEATAPVTQKSTRAPYTGLVGFRDYFGFLGTDRSLIASGSSRINPDVTIEVNVRRFYRTAGSE